MKKIGKDCVKKNKKKQQNKTKKGRRRNGSTEPENGKKRVKGQS